MEFDYIKGINLGYGFNTATFDFHSPAIEDVSSTRDVPGAGGQEVYFKVELSSSTLRAWKGITFTSFRSNGSTIDS